MRRGNELASRPGTRRAELLKLQNCIHHAHSLDLELGSQIDESHEHWEIGSSGVDRASVVASQARESVKVAPTGLPAPQTLALAIAVAIFNPQILFQSRIAGSVP